MRQFKVMTQSFPDFYIIGAPKCGTTALYAYLGTNTGIFTSELKEPHFFASDFTNIRQVKALADYLALFAPARAGQKTGEASVWYLYSQVAVAEIAEKRPDAKLIVMLRNPVDAAQSMHAQQVISLVEDISDFPEAWHAQADRAAGRRIPFFCTDAAMLLYGSIYSYAEQLERVLRAFPAEQVKVVIYEEMFETPEHIYGEIQDFLGVNRQSIGMFERVNTGRAPGNVLLHRFVTRPPPPLRPFYRVLSALSRRFGLHLGALALRLMRERPLSRPTLPPAFRAEMETFFAGDIARLEGLLGRKLGVWRTPS
jgi:hypothetical protein